MINELKKYWKEDMLSGFLVFILALPLSMGIAQASEFEPIYGLLTAMIGGLVVALFAGSPLTIKGPAAGLIVIVAGAVNEFGGGEMGWRFTLGAVLVAGIFQILFGLLKMGKLSDFFPLPAVHGMLAAIGIIIISKQLHGLLGINPMHKHLDPSVVGAAGDKPLVKPFELFEAMPHSLQHLNHHALIIGIVSLIVVLGWPLVKHPVAKKIPAPLLVLLVAIPLSKLIGLDEKLFVHFDKSLHDIMELNVSFGGLETPSIFIKYVVMFSIVGSLEALLTVKAIDMRDPLHRNSNTNKDLSALGLGNAIAGALGGLPMISEVARSSANVNNGGKSRWSNFFHGFFMLIFLLLAVQFSGLIPKPALSAMLIGVGLKLAHPNEFKHMLKIGRDQLFIFLLTIIVTLATDLLLGILAGILLKLIFEISKGLKFSEVFKAKVDIQKGADQYEVIALSSLVFSNYISLTNQLNTIPKDANVKLIVSNISMIDHSTMENLQRLSSDFKAQGGQFELVGLERFIQLSADPLSVRINKDINKK